MLPRGLLLVCWWVVVACGVGSGLGLGAKPLIAQTLPPGFSLEVAIGALNQPTAVEFAPDGRVFVAEKSGIIRVYDDLDDSTPTTFADLRQQVFDYWDRGLLGLAVHPQFPGQPYVYVLYTLDAPPGQTPPVYFDQCPDPTGNGCVVGARLSRLTAAGDVMTGSEAVLLEGWCQQYPSHSIGDLAFGLDGALYVTSGDGASFNFVDWGQGGSPPNPCADPFLEGGALRSQDLLTLIDPVDLNGGVLRLDPITGQPLPDNPLFGGITSADDAFIATGLRNPYRMAADPSTGALWIGDVGWYSWEEINHVPDPTDAVVENFGWPCYEGSGAHPQYDAQNLPLCEGLYVLPGSVTPPHFAYQHQSAIDPPESCPTGSSAIAGLAVYPGGSYPAAYDGALFFADFSRACIWAMLPGASGVPDPAQIHTFVAQAGQVVDLAIGPGGDLCYVHLGGFIVRVRHPVSFVRGDTNGDGLINIADAVVALGYLFQGAAVNCRDALDANDDGALDISDPIYHLAYQFSGGLPPPPPFGVFPTSCGLDPTPDAGGGDLGCDLGCP